MNNKWIRYLAGFRLNMNSALIHEEYGCILIETLNNQWLGYIDENAYRCDYDVACTKTDRESVEKFLIDLVRKREMLLNE